MRRGEGGINRRKKLRVSDIVDKSRPVGVSRRLTENFVVAGAHETPREHFSLIRWEVPSVRLVDRLPAQFVGSWSANSQFIVELLQNFDNDYIFRARFRASRFPSTLVSRTFRCTLLRSIKLGLTHFFLVISLPVRLYRLI